MHTAYRPAMRVIGVALAIGCSVASAASATTPQELTVASPDKIAVTSGGDLSTTIAVLNAGPTTPVAFRVAGDKAINVTPASARAKANNVTRITLTFKPQDSATKAASGELIMTAGARPPSAIPFALTSKPEAPDWVVVVIFAPLVVAALLIIFAWLSLSADQPNLRTRLGPIDWDFSKSFASNVTVFSAVLGTILAAGVLPQDLPADRVATYAALNLLFGIAVIAGPFLYTACQRPKPVNRRGPIKEVQYQGYVWTFLVASIVTVWATAGEFATIARLFSDIRTGGSLPEAGLIAFVVLIVIGGLALVLLIWTRSRAILSAQGEGPKKQAHKAARHAALVAEGVTGLPSATSEAFEPELDAWTSF